MKPLKTLLLVLFGFAIQAQTWQPLTYNPDQDSLELNPLKGLTPLYNVNNDFPHSMRGSIISFDSIMNGIDDFNWSIFDDFINEQAEKGRFSYLQVNIDMGKAHVDLPEFLQEDVEHFKYVGGSNPGDNGVSSLVVNYNNETLMLAMLNFIERFGERYNDNPRVFLVHYGLYGIFGEWDLGFGGNFVPAGEEWEMSEINQLRITSAYENAFDNKNLLARFPENVPESQAVGYSDGLYFGASVSDDPNFGWFFLPKLVQNNADLNWMNHPIGGEIDPYVQPTLWEQFPNNVTGDPALIGGDPANIPIQNTDNVFDLTHPTFLFQDWIFNNPLSTMMRSNAEKATRRCGYTFNVSEYRVTVTNAKPTFEVKIQNQGVAPIYENWEVEFAYLDGNGMLESLGKSNQWNLKTIQPSATEHYRSFSSDSIILDGTYTFMLKIVNPLEALITDPLKAKPIRFANTTQDIDLNGWLTLGQASIANGTLGSAPIPVTGLTISPSSVTLCLDEELQFTSIVTPGNATNTSLTWISNRPSTLSVDENGLVKSNSIAGDVEITGFTQDGAIESTSAIEVIPFWEIPRKVEAEGFSEVFNAQVNNAPAGEAGGGKVLGFINDETWIDYQVKVNSPTAFVLDVRASSPFGIGFLNILNSSGEVLSSVALTPATGNYDTYALFTSEPFTLESGEHILRLDVVTSALNLNWLEFKALPNTFTFLGSGDDDYLTASNWDTGLVPPEYYPGTISVESDCKVTPGYEIKLGSTGILVVKEGKTLEFMTVE